MSEQTVYRIYGVPFGAEYWRCDWCLRAPTIWLWGLSSGPMAVCGPCCDRLREADRACGQAGLWTLASPATDELGGEER